MDTGAFCRRIQGDGNRFRSRVLVIPSYGDFQTVCANYGGMFEVVRTSDFVSADRFVPMPESVFASLAEKRRRLRERGRQAIVIGLDGYLSLLCPKEVRTAFGIIAADLGGAGGESVVYVFRRKWGEMDGAFTHPSIFSTHAFCEIGDCGHGQWLPPQPVFVGTDFSSRIAGCKDSLTDYLREIEGWSGAASGEGVSVAVRFNGEYPFSGIAKEIRQYPCLRLLFAEYCHFNADLSEAAFRWISENTKGTAIEDELSAHFFPNGIAGLCETVLARYDRLFGADEREVFLHVAEKFAPRGSYLSLVLSSIGENVASFVERYVNAPEAAIRHVDARKFAEEREVGVRNLGLDRMDVKTAEEAFVGKTGQLPAEQMEPWLRLGLDCEGVEWTRRCAAGEDVLRFQPLLGAYFSSAVDVAPALRQYFKAYREAKVRDFIDDSLCKSAHDFAMPDEIASRSALLAQYRGDNNAYLLVVDAMGGEYLDFLCARLDAHRFAVSVATMAKTNLPTSTRFNPVYEEWGEERYVKFDDFDKLLHKTCDRAETGIFHELRMLENEVLGQVENLLKRFSRVVLTADHGSSRLAVVARREGLARDLKELCDKVDVEDWRFAKCRDGKSVESDDIAETLAGDRVAVKGYNRFPRPGAPGFEMHGGATPEEMLVPFIVIERRPAQDAPSCPRKAEHSGGETAAASSRPATEQISEDNDFDI